jgi:hypothetical protein
MVKSKSTGHLPLGLVDSVSSDGGARLTTCMISNPLVLITVLKFGLIVAQLEIDLTIIQ